MRNVGIYFLQVNELICIKMRNVCTIYSVSLIDMHQTFRKFGILYLKEEVFCVKYSVTFVAGITHSVCLIKTSFIPYVWRKCITHSVCLKTLHSIFRMFESAALNIPYVFMILLTL